MDSFLVAVVTICVLKTGPTPDAHCHDKNIYSKRPYNAYVCEGIMIPLIGRMSQELKQQLKPSEMLSMSYECILTPQEGLGQT